MLKEAESAIQGAYMVYVNAPVSSFTTNSALLPYYRSWQLYKQENKPFL